MLRSQTYWDAIARTIVGQLPEDQRQAFINWVINDVGITNIYIASPRQALYLWNTGQEIPDYLQVSEGL